MPYLLTFLLRYLLIFPLSVNLLVGTILFLSLIADRLLSHCCSFRIG